IVDECCVRKTAGSWYGYGTQHAISSKEPGENGKGHTTSAARRECGASIGREIPLSVLELIQEAILEDVDLVEVNRAPNLDCMVTYVAGLDGHVLANLSLNAE